jgi:predicted nucleic acid-binding protein
MILVDSNVLLDVITSDPIWGEASAEAIARLGDSEGLAINAIIYAEVSVGYSSIELLEDALPAKQFARLSLPWEAGFLAGKCFLAHKRRGSNRPSPLPDFYIGAHAAVSGLKLLTRDVARYRTYFPHVKLIEPKGSRP